MADKKSLTHLVQIPIGEKLSQLERLQTKLDNIRADVLHHKGIIKERTKEAVEVEEALFEAVRNIKQEEIVEES